MATVCLVRYETSVGLHRRYLEMAYWTMETMGQSLPDAVANTIRWREGAGPHLVTDQQVSFLVEPWNVRKFPRHPQ